jgi:hypothetical protein
VAAGGAGAGPGREECPQVADNLVEAQAYLGEWDYPLNKALHKALDLYMSRR